MPTWDGDLYLKFATERTRPAEDLVARLALDAPSRVADLGCGPGNSTVIGARRHGRPPGLLHEHEPVGIGIRQRAKQHGADETEHGRRGADPCDTPSVTSCGVRRLPPQSS